MSKKAQEPAVGLDFGTTTTLVASRTGVTPIGQVTPWLPSLVGYGDDDAVLIGEATTDLPAEQVVRSVKRAITDRRDYVSVDLPTGLCDVPADDLMIGVLREAVQRASASGVSLAGNVRLGCPAMWDGDQRRRLVELAQSADINVTLASLVDEPVAAGIAWLYSQMPPPNESGEPLRVVVFDMGGGTLDIAVLDIRGAEQRDVSVRAAISVPEAGDTLDGAIARDLEEELADAGVEVPPRLRARLLDVARDTKIALSGADEFPVALPDLPAIRYTRDMLNAAFAPQMDFATQCVILALRAARLTEKAPQSYEDVDALVDDLIRGVDFVVLSGGMSRIRYVAMRLQHLFPSTTVELATDPPENAVALGLSKADEFGRINMYRPSFDIYLEFDRGRENRMIYEAFTPLFEARQLLRVDGEVGHTRTWAELSMPAKGKGRLRVVSQAGETVHATLDEQPLHGYSVTLSEAFEFTIQCNGRLRMTDATGTVEGQIDDWHTT